MAFVSRLMHLSMPPPPPPLMWLVYPSDLDITETKSVISRAKVIILCRNFPEEGGWRGTHSRVRVFCQFPRVGLISGPSCSKLTTSLVKVSLKISKANI